jgi:hypothetical protein
VSVLNLGRRSLTDTGSADETFVIHAGLQFESFDRKRSLFGAIVLLRKVRHNVIDQRINLLNTFPQLRVRTNLRGDIFTQKGHEASPGRRSPARKQKYIHPSLSTLCFAKKHCLLYHDQLMLNAKSQGEVIVGIVQRRSLRTRCRSSGPGRVEDPSLIALAQTEPVPDWFRFSES